MFSAVQHDSPGGRLGVRADQQSGSERSGLSDDPARERACDVGGTVGPIDLNTIPSSMIDHVEILNDGASSIYGSDAVAGVVNIITKTNQDGGELHVYGDASQAGGGNSYQVNGSWGKTSDRGYLNVGFDYYRQDALTLGQRGFLSCATDNVVDATTHQRRTSSIRRLASRSASISWRLSSSTMRRAFSTRRTPAQSRAAGLPVRTSTDFRPSDLTPVGP